MFIFLPSFFVENFQFFPVMNLYGKLIEIEHPYYKKSVN